MLETFGTPVKRGGESISDGRRKRARATEERIVAAATRLFIRDGYLATTVADIAAEAGVAVQSIYLRFGSKLALLKSALDVAVVGDVEPVPLLERKWFDEVVRAEDGAVAVRLFVVQAAAIMSRTYPLYSVIRAAAAGETGEILAQNKRERFEGNRRVAAELSRKRGYANGLSVRAAADLIYSLVSEDHYGLLVADRGRKPEEWARLCAELLQSTLFPRVTSRSSQRSTSPRPSRMTTTGTSRDRSW